MELGDQLRPDKGKNPISFFEDEKLPEMNRYLFTFRDMERAVARIRQLFVEDPQLR